MPCHRIVFPLFPQYRLCRGTGSATLSEMGFLPQRPHRLYTDLSPARRIVVAFEPLGTIRNMGKQSSSSRFSSRSCCTRRFNAGNLRIVACELMAVRSEVCVRMRGSGASFLPRFSLLTCCALRMQSSKARLFTIVLACNSDVWHGDKIQGKLTACAHVPVNRIVNPW